MKYVRSYYFITTLFLSLVTTRLVAQPIASFTANKLSGCAGQLQITFTNTSTGATNYLWDLGDGDQSNDVNPSKFYMIPGTKTIKLVASDGITSDSITITIQAFRSPVAQFTLNKDTTCTNVPVCTNQNITLGDAALDPSKCFWDFGFPPTIPTISDACFSYTTPGKYQVSRFLVDSNGCQGTLVVPNAIVVSPPPVSSFTVSQQNSCKSPMCITFTNNSSHPQGLPIGYLWNFGDGTFSTTPTPPQKCFNVGSYNIVLTANDPKGCSSVDSIRINVNNDIKADFTLSSNSLCRNDTVFITNTSTGIGGNVTCSWNFGDNTTSTDCNPSKKYTTNGSRRIKLTVTSGTCTDTISKLITVSEPINKDSIDFTGTPRQKCVPPLVVNFTGKATGAASVQYDWGHNGNTCPTLNCSYTYTQMGCYDVSLYATNPQGCVSSITKENYICIESFKAQIDLDSSSGCMPLTVNFTNATTVGSPIVDCKWSMGDGTVYSNNCNSPVQYTFQNSGTYNVWLRVETADGCFDTARTTITVRPKPAADFTASPLQACLKVPIKFTCLCNGGTSYLWDFGPGSSTQQSPTYVYDEIGQHTVTLTVKNAGCATIVKKVNYIESLVPKADFRYSTACGNPLKAEFTSTSQGADSLWWRFDDNLPMTARDTITQKTYTYPAIGQYQASLFVYNGQTGCIDSITKTVNLFSQNKTFGADKINACVGGKINFADSTNFGSKWTWYFGDGDTSSQRNPTKVYQTPGKYTVKLVINKGLPCTDSIIKVNYITIHKPDASFTQDKVSGCSPLTVNFSSTSTPNTAPISQWRWSFNANGTGAVGNVVSTTGDTTWTFTSGPITVKLIVTDTVGCKDTVRASAAINPTTISPKFDIVDMLTGDSIVGCPCAGQEVGFKNNTTASTSSQYTYVWNFGDGSSATKSNKNTFPHIYTQNGTYDVTLTVISNSDTLCRQSITKQLCIQSLNLDFSNSSITVACPPYATQFNNTSQDTAGVSYTWYFGDKSQPSDEFNPIHAYYFPGDYDVSLVGQKGICRDSMVKPKLIQILGPRLEDIQSSPPFGCRPLNVVFTGKIYETKFASLQWRVGDAENIPIVYGDTLYLSKNHIYSDPEFDTGYVKPILLLEDDKGCKVSYPLDDSLYIDEYPYPNQRDTSVCIGAIVEYELSDGDFFKWEPADYLSCDTCKFVVANAPDTITYTITANTIWGCEAKDTITLNVEDLPKLNIQPDSFLRLCKGETAILCAGDVYNALWSPPTNISSPTAICPTVTAIDTTTWIVYSENRLGHQPGCYVYDTITLFVIDTVKVDFIPDTSVCVGEKLQLDIKVLEASYNDTSFFWYPTTFLDNPNQQNPIANLPYSMDFTVVIKSPLCVPDTHTFNVRVDPLPDIDLYRDTVVVVETEVELSALSFDAVQYSWTSVDELSCTDCATPTIIANNTQWVYVTVKNQYGCESGDSAYIKVIGCDPDFLFVPTVFTPNGDGLNDKLFVRGKALKELKTFIVTNRWGNVVFSTTNIKEGWDGTFRGQMSPMDAYVWYVKGICTNGNEVEKKGTITLIR